MIPIWVNIDDLKPNPNETLEWAKNAFGEKKLKEWEESLKKDGYNPAKLLLVDWRGSIMDGNVRYHLCKKLGIKYVRIDFNYLINDLNAFIRTQQFKWSELIKLESPEYEDLKKFMEQLIEEGVFRRTTEVERLKFIATEVEKRLKKRTETKGYVG